MRILDTVFVYRLAEGERLIHHGRYHSHPDNEFEIHFFIDGNGALLLNNTRYSFSNNTLFLVGPHEFHSILLLKNSRPVTYYAVLFSLSDEDEQLRHILQQVLDHCRYKSVDPINKFNFEEILRLSQSEHFEFAQSGKYLFMSHLYRWFSLSSETLSIEKTYHKAKETNQLYVRKATAIMEKNLYSNITVEQMAYRIGLSTEHFIRIFKEEIKMTPYQYFTRLKIQSASAELISTDKTVLKISEEYHFENQFHFSRVFKKCTGVSPSVYKKLYSTEP